MRPVVRSDEEDVAGLLASFNEALARDGYELSCCNPKRAVGEHPVIAGQSSGLLMRCSGSEPGRGGCASKES
ncbi:hypothetical protein [Mycolicibacterium sp. YH-1]|uniref:hypothetical protein n=1 Tax=Mycolicibacterium sp. YH-1 TaxID=2908837 RepID=UPI00352E3919